MLTGEHAENGRKSICQENRVQLILEPSEISGLCILPKVNVLYVSVNDLGPSKVLGNQECGAVNYVGPLPVVSAIKIDADQSLHMNVVEPALEIVCSSRERLAVTSYGFL